VYQKAFALTSADLVFVGLLACAGPAARARSTIANTRIAIFLIAASFLTPVRT
jgi:hypothetical protein